MISLANLMFFPIRLLRQNTFQNQLHMINLPLINSPSILKLLLRIPFIQQHNNILKLPHRLLAPLITFNNLAPSQLNQHNQILPTKMYLIHGNDEFVVVEDFQALVYFLDGLFQQVCVVQFQMEFWDGLAGIGVGDVAQPSTINNGNALSNRIQKFIGPTIFLHNQHIIFLRHILNTLQSRIHTKGNRWP